MCRTVLGLIGEGAELGRFVIMVVIGAFESIVLELNALAPEILKNRDQNVDFFFPFPIILSAHPKVK